MGQVHRGPHDAIFGPGFRTDIAHHHLPGMEADPHVERRQLLADAGQVDAQHGLLHRQGALQRLPPHRGQGTVQRIKKGQDRIPQEIHDDAVMPAQHLHHPGKITVDQLNGGLRAQGLGNGGKTPDVGEHDDHLPFFSAQTAGFRPLHEFAAISWST